MTGIPYEIEDDSYYLYTCAELSARENELVSRTRIDRMVSAADIEEFMKILGETIYASETGTINRLNSFETVMVSRYGDIIEYLDERLRDTHKNLIYVLFFEEFLHNLKLILKSLLLETSLYRLYIPLRYGYDTLMKAYGNRKYEGMGSPVPETLEHIRGLMEVPGEEEPRKMELSLEAFYTGMMLDTAGSLGRRMIKDYVRYKIDLINIETIYRHTQLKEKAPFARLLHGGGSLDLKFLTGLEGESMDYIVKQLEKTDYADVIIRGAQMLFSDCNFSAFERNRDIYILGYFDNIKYSVSNLEKIFQFFLKKKIELTTMNILYTGIRFDSAKPKIRCKVE